jgi:hypothetical protein
MSLPDHEDEDPRTVAAAWVKEVSRRQREIDTRAVTPMTAEESIALVASDDPAEDLR